ncbi:MAG: hypothetical protein ABSB42_03540 [Tepidisphaeraceae bacterium]|jgi:hypothetical protein
MIPNGYSDGASTEGDRGEVEYRRRGRQMVQELELFLRAELACPREGRRISFLSARRDGSIGSVASVTPAEE